MSKFTVTIEADSLPELADRVLALAGQLNASRDPVMPEVKETKSKPKAQKEAPAAEGEAAAVETQSAPAEPAEQSASTPAAPSEEKPAPQKEPEVKAAEAAAGDADTVRALTLKVVGQGGRPKVEAILKEFGLNRTTEVDDARRQEMINALTDALAA